MTMSFKRRLLFTLGGFAFVSMILDFQDGANMRSLMASWRDHWKEQEEYRSAGVSTSQLLPPSFAIQPESEAIIQPKPAPSTMNGSLMMPPLHVLQKPANLTRPNLWIHVNSYSEGIASWKIAFTSLLSVAKYANAVLVEPCITHGRLHSCRKKTIGQIRFGQVFDMDRVRQQFYPHVASQEEFEQVTGYHYNTTTSRHTIHNSTFRNNLYRVCLSKQKESCKLPNGEMMPSTWFQSQQPDLHAALVNGRNVPTLLNIESYSRKALQKFKTKWPFKPKGANATYVTDVLGVSSEHLLHIIDYHYENVESMLYQTLGLPQGTPYAALQWRPERITEDYIPCAKAILEARDIISKKDNIPKENFVLISPLSLNKALQWGPLAMEANEHNATSYPSLQMLLDAGFQKLEQAFTGSTIPDEIFLVIWDFILAQKAQSFTTCSECDETTEYCSKCNWQGRASQYAVHLRQTENEKETTDNGKTTHTCWPTNKEASNGTVVSAGAFPGNDHGTGSTTSSR